MADLVVGLSKTAVQLLTDKVKSAIKEEAEQWKIVQRDLVFITGEFEMMQAFLDTASEEHVKNRIVRTWVRQVRDLSNDVEDNIDFILGHHLDITKQSWWLRLLRPCSCGKTGAELPVDEAVAETTMLRARVVDVSQRNIRYNLIADSASKPMPAAMDLVQKTAASSFDVLINAIKKSGPLDLDGLIGTNDRDLQVVSFCETEGDLVQVAIVRKAFSDARICTEFACRAWVKLMHPFNALEFIRSLMTQFLAHSCQEHVNVGPDALEWMLQATQGDLIKEFSQKENNHRYLIVLENLSTLAQWDAIRAFLPDRKNGSRIVVLTNHPVVASQCVGEPCQVSELEQFSPGHSVRIYYKEGFQHDRVQSFIMSEPRHSLFNDLIGRDNEMDELFKKTQESRLISVWGMPGVGKSALVKTIYDKLRVSDQFKRHAWVNVSHPFDPTDCCRRILVSLHRESTSSEGNAKALQAEDPIEECRYHLSEFVCLLVIDGVQSNEDWDWIKSNLVQYRNSGSCIIIITSEESVAKHCAASNDGVYNVKGLHDTAANLLFNQVLQECGFYSVKRNEEEETPSEESYEVDWNEEEEIASAAELLLSKCGGLPRVIATVAGYLAIKRRDLLEQEMRHVGQHNFMEEMRTEMKLPHQMMMRLLNEKFPYVLGYMSGIFVQEMRRLSNNLIEEVATNPHFALLRDIQAWMHSYLEACPWHLKKCMLYLSIFPQDTIIRRSRLIRRWIAEGYSKGNHSDSNSMEKHAEKIFDEVAALSIMQPVLEAGKVIGYQVNFFFREYIMSRPVEETILFPVQVSALEKLKHGRLTTEGVGQHLAIGSTWEIDRVALDSMDLSRLRSLTVFNMWFKSFYVSHRMRVLRVLDLENAVIDSASDFEVIGKLPSLIKFLSLRGQKVISQLPESVGDLSQLQTLDIRDTSIVTLPPFITGLRKLQCIRAGTTVAWASDAEEGSTLSSTSSWSSKSFRRGGVGPVVGSCSGGVVVPTGIVRLQVLQTLGAICVNTAGGDRILDEILSLPQLKKLEVTGISEKHTQRSFWRRLKNTAHLESLKLQFMKVNHSLPWKNIFPNLPKSLQSLMMYGHVGQLLRDITELVNVAKLTLQPSTQFRAPDLRVLADLPSLRTLRLRLNDVEDGRLQFDSLFSKLQVLEIAFKSKLPVMFHERRMEKLEQLKIHCLQGSEIQISGLKHLVSLKQVWLLGSFDDELVEAARHQCVNHPKKPHLKLERQPRSYQPPRIITFLERNKRPLVLRKKPSVTLMEAQ